eukprot:1143338-Pelagomonas_calceolata.AAC.6
MAVQLKLGELTGLNRKLQAAQVSASWTCCIAILAIQGLQAFSTPQPMHAASMRIVALCEQVKGP